MSIKWDEPKFEELKRSEAPPVWLPVIAFIVIYVVCFVLTILDWKQSKSIISAEFFVRVLLIPLIVWGLACCAIYFNHEDWNERVEIFNNLCQRRYAQWRWWAQERVAILGHITLTPEQRLAERMLGLEGSTPANAGKMLPLQFEKPRSASRVQQVLEELLTPFVAYLSRFPARQSFRIVIQSARQDDVNDLRALLRKLSPHDFKFIEVEWTSLALDMEKVEHWLSDHNRPDFCLVLAYQLHAAGNESTCSEAAVAVLFASSTAIENSKGELEPQAWVFRPIPATTDRAFGRLKTLLAARQAPDERIKHLWLSHIPGQGKHATLTAVKDTGLGVAEHDLDTAIGVPGPVNTLLVQALAAQMVQHGQGTQMVATPYKGGVMLNLIGTDVALVRGVAERPPRAVNACLTGVLIGMLLLLLLVFLDEKVSMGYFIAWFAGLLAVLIVQAIFSFIRHSQVEDYFYSQSPW